MDVYLARQVVESNLNRNKAAEAMKDLGIAPGAWLGSLVFNDGKLMKSVKVDKVNDSENIVITGKAW